MKKTLAGVVIIAFAGLLCTSVLAVFSSTKMGNQYASSQSLQYPYLIAY